MPEKNVGKRETNKRANRAAILEAARRVFLDEGYDSVTIRDVIRATNLAAGTFYNYFPDKESLFRALVEDRLFQLTAKVSAARRSAMDFESFLHDAYVTVFREVCEQRSCYELIFRNEQIVRSLYDGNLFGDGIRALKADITDAIARGLLPQTNIDYLAAALFGAGYEMARVMLESKNPNVEEGARYLVRVFLAGIPQALQPDAPRLIRRGPLKLRGSAR